MWLFRPLFHRCLFLQQSEVARLDQLLQRPVGFGQLGLSCFLPSWTSSRGNFSIKRAAPSISNSTTFHHVTAFMRLFFESHVHVMSAHLILLRSHSAVPTAPCISSSCWPTNIAAHGRVDKARWPFDRKFRPKFAHLGDEDWESHGHPQRMLELLDGLGGILQDDEMRRRRCAIREGSAVRRCDNKCNDENRSSSGRHSAKSSSPTLHELS